MSDGEENTAPPVQAAAPQNPPAEPATQPAHHPTSGPKDIRMHAMTPTKPAAAVKVEE